MVRSNKFCCCLPVRFGVLCMSVIWLILGGVVAGLGWHMVRSQDSASETRRQRTALIIQTLLYTVLAILSLFGLYGALTRRRSLVSAYSTILSVHLGFSVGTGAFYLFTLFHSDSVNQAIDACVSQSGMDGDIAKEVCEKSLKVLRGAIVGVLVFVWLVELYGCVIVSSYVSQLADEEEAKGWNKTITVNQPDAVPVATMSTTYTNPYMPPQQQQQPPSYAFAAPQNGYGSNNV